MKKLIPKYKPNAKALFDQAVEKDTRLLKSLDAADPKEVAKALTTQLDEGRTLLHVIVEKYEQKHHKKVIEIFKKIKALAAKHECIEEAMSEAVCMQKTSSGDTPLQLFFHDSANGLKSWLKHPQYIFSFFVDMLSQKALDAAIKIENSNHQNPLESAARCKANTALYPHPLVTLIDKASLQTLNELMQEQGYLLFELLSFCNRTDSDLTIFKKFRREVLGAALVEKIDLRKVNPTDILENTLHKLKEKVGCFDWFINWLAPLILIKLCMRGIHQRTHHYIARFLQKK